MATLVSKLYPVRAKWYDLGLGLGVCADDLDAIRKDSTTSGECLREMLKLWLSKTPVKANLIKALNDPAHGDDENLANQLDLWQQTSPALDVSDESSPSVKTAKILNRVHEGVVVSNCL